MSKGFFIGEVVKVIVHTANATDLYRRYGKVVEIGVSHVEVEFADLGCYWIAGDLLKDAGAL